LTGLYLLTPITPVGRHRSALRLGGGFLDPQLGYAGSIAFACREFFDLWMWPRPWREVTGEPLDIVEPPGIDDAVGALSCCRNNCVLRAIRAEKSVVAQRLVERMVCRTG